MTHQRSIGPRGNSGKLFWFLILLPSFLLGCGQKKDSILPAELDPTEVMVTGTVPDSGELMRSQTFGFIFAGDLITQKEIQDPTPQNPPARIKPAIPGTWRWQESGHLVFSPDEPYQPNTRYQVKLAPKYFTKLGLTLRGQKQFELLTQPFTCRHFRLRRNRVRTHPARYVVTGEAVFNYDVDPQKFLAAMKCNLDGDPVEISMVSQATERTMSFQTPPLEVGKSDRSLICILSKKLMPVTGDVHLNKDQVQVIDIPAIDRLNIRNVKVSSQGESPLVEIIFSDQVLPEDLQHMLTIEPAVDKLRIVGRYRVLELQGQWQIGQTYQLTIQPELTSQDGVPLERLFTRTVTIHDLDPLVRIAGEGNFLSLRGDRQLAIETINVSDVDIQVDRIFPNNLVPFLQKINLQSGRRRFYGWSLENQGTKVFGRALKISAEVRNKLQVTPVDLQHTLSEDSRGIFRLSVTDPSSHGQGDSRWLVATDLGLIAKHNQDQVEVAVASISQLRPVARVKIQVLSYNNQVLASGYTDQEGMISFKGLSWENRGARPFVVVATLGQDLSFLPFNETQIRTADLDVGGVAQTDKGYRAYLYGDRNIYRPGERAHLVWIVRDGNLQPPADVPLNLKIRGPEGQDFLNAKVSCDRAGTGEFNLDLPTWAATGRYNALLSLGQDNLLGETNFQVEDFIPDRMKVSAEYLVGGHSPHIVGPTDKVNLKALAMTLFGPPAAGRTANANVWFKKTPVQIPGYESFTFGDEQGDELPPRRDLGQLQTDDAGQAQWEVPLPQVADYQGWLQMSAVTKVSESGGGRVVSALATTIFSPTDKLIGLRNLNDTGSDYTEPGQVMKFQAVMVDLAGQPQPDPAAHLKVMRKQWRTVLKHDQAGKFHYVSEYDENLVEELTVALTAGPTDLEITPNTNGSYRLILENSAGTIRGSLNFYVYGYGYSPWAMNNPEKVNLKLDRDTYANNDVVTAAVEAPFPGLMLLTVERDRVYSSRWVRMTSNTITVQVSLPKGSTPNVYLTATVLRSLDQLDLHTPARAFGAVPIFIEREPNTLPIEIAAPEKMRPRHPLNLRVKLPANGHAMRMTVAAVDEGILQLTNYHTPSALDYFLQRRRLGVESFDIWSLLLPEYERVKRQSATGGGANESVANCLMAVKNGAKRLNPLAATRVKPVALWSGLLEGTRGWQDISFEVPEFNGTLRVVVVAVSGDRFGSAATQIKVTDPLVLSPSLPRFLAPGDQFRVPVPVYNGLPATSDLPQEVGLKLVLDGPVAGAPGEDLTTTLPVAPNQENLAWFDLQAADSIGIAQVEFQAQAAGESVSVTTELSVRPPSSLDSRVYAGTVDQDHVFQQTISDQWYPGSGFTTVTVAANPMGRFGAALPYLLRYPYGCVEQITSRSFPLLYFGELATRLAPGEFGDRDADYFVNSGLDHVAAMFRAGVGFSMWPGRHRSAGRGQVNPWATTYVTHFLTEAQKRGYVLPDGLLDGALKVVADYARSSDHGWPDDWIDSNRLRTRAYACYVLALADHAERGAMDQMAHQDWAQLSSTSRTLLAGAYALTGNPTRFAELLPAGDAPVTAERSSGYTWYSEARDEAIRLDVLATVAPDHPQISRLFQRLAGRAKNGRWYNTQENAFALVAMGKLSASGKLLPADGQILVDGHTVAEFDTTGASIQSRDWAGKQVEIRTTTPGSAWFTILDEGVPKKPDNNDLDAGLVVSRDFFDTQGRPVDPLNLVQGQTIICRLLLSSNKGKVKDVVITDLLPAGLEIENPRLVRGTGYDWTRMDRQQNKFSRLPEEHLEIRDDRLLLFTSVSGNQTGAFYYTLRAITIGEFAWPQVKAEAMYDPEVMSVRGGGKVKVVAP